MQAIIYGMRLYFSSSQARFTKPQISIEQEINKIFVIPKGKIMENDQSTSSLDQQSTTFVSLKISSYDGSDLKLKKLNHFKNIISLLIQMSSSELIQEEIDYFQVNFEEYLGYNQKHLTILVSLFKYFCDSLLLEVTIIISLNAQLNRELSQELSQGLYIIGYNQLQKSKSNATDSEALSLISELVLKMEHEINLSTVEKQKIFRKILDLCPPQFEVVAVNNFLYKDQNINLMKISPYITINHLLEYFTYKFLIIDSEQFENKENFIEFEQIINEIESKLSQLMFTMQQELESIFIFHKIDVQMQQDKCMLKGRSTERQINSGRLVKNRQYGSFNGSKGDEIQNETLQHQNAFQESAKILKQLFLQTIQKLVYLFHLSGWQEKKLASNTLFKSALVKARPTCIPYFYITFVTFIFMPLNYYYSSKFDFDNVYTSFLGIHLTIFQLNNISFVLLLFVSLLQIITNITPALSHYKLVNNSSNLQTDAIKNLINVNDSKTLEQPKIGIGKKLVCFIQEVVLMCTLYFLFYSIYTTRQTLKEQFQGNLYSFNHLISNLMFFIITTLAVSLSVLSQPEELVSLTLHIKLFFIVLFFITGVYYHVPDMILFLFLSVIMLNYYIPQLQNFINHGRQQEQNFNLLKLKSKQIQHRIPTFTMLVYNILASKYVSLNNVIQSNYILRRAKVINQMEDDMPLTDNFFDKLCHYRNLLQDKQKRQNSCIVYPQVVISIFEKPELWSFDDQLDFNDIISEMPQIYQMPIDNPNAVYFVESENQQHLHNAIQLIIAFSQGAMKKQKINRCAITAGQLTIYILEAGQLHVRSQCILDSKNLISNYEGLIIDGNLYQIYKGLDDRFKFEVQNRLTLCKNQEEIDQMKSMLLRLWEINYDNGKAVRVEIRK
eukprot:EST46296.1 Transmembrane domain-containing protein [Spironucleus salmonicida]